MINAFNLGMDILTRLQPELTNLRKNNTKQAMARERIIPKITMSIPSISEMIKQIGPLPPQSIIIGYCEDGLHVFLDLHDSNPGAILIAGDTGSGKTRLINSILTSACLINHPRQVRYSIISPKTDELGELLTKPHTYKVISPASDGAEDLIKEFVEIAEQRKSGRQLGTTLILAIDDLAYFLNTIDPEIQDMLKWLILNGPESRVWVLATLASSDVEKVNSDVLNCFGTRLIGKIESQEAASYFIGDIPDKFGELSIGAQFGVYFNNEWVKFWIPTAQ
jgi:hypothetical protein